MSRLAAFARHVLGTGTPGPDPPVQELDTVRFVCNLCGALNRVAPASLDRETPSCEACGSNVRCRSVIQLLVHALTGRDETLADLPVAKHVRGIGVSDSPGYARHLAEKFDYANTYLHQEPRLDLTAIPGHLAGQHDFAICSEVLEHVEPPVARAFAGARALLKPGGLLVGSVPFELDPDTREHFPELFRWAIDYGEPPILRNLTRSGEEQAFDGLVFHGGDGSTLEMRLFSRAGLLRALHDAGFTEVAFADEPVPRFGIAWTAPFSIPFSARV